MKITLCYLLLICLLLTAVAGGQGENGNSCHNVDVGRYANLNFCIPSSILVQPGTGTEGSFALGRYASTTALIGGKNVEVYLLYPCTAPTTGLTQQDVQALVESLRPYMSSPGATIYYTNVNPMQMSGQNAVWGSTNYNGVIQTFAAYQPAPGIVEALFFDGSMSPEIVSSVLQSMQTSVDQRISPIRPGDCAAVAAPPLVVAEPVITPVYYWPYWNHGKHWRDNVSPWWPTKPKHTLS